MEIMARTNQSLAELISELKTFPQRIQNVPVRERVPLTDVPDVQRAIQSAERELDGNGRVIVRYSGTEPLARVMVEAESEEKMQRIADMIASSIKTAIGT